MCKTANNKGRVSYENRKQIRCTEKIQSQLVSRGRLETPIPHKLDSFQAVPKEATIKEKNHPTNHPNPHFQDAKVDQIKK